jgi:hypothetical protein
MNFYLIQHPKKSALLYTEGERTLLETPDSTKDFVDQWVDWLRRRDSRVANMFKNLTIVVRDYYYRLEYRIDPMERVLKRLRHASEIRLHYASALSETQANKLLERLLTKQGNKHTFWLGVDFFMTLIAILLSPILIPLPGPNIFFYYPGLRAISHFLAWRGTRHGFQLSTRFFFPQDEISDIETVLDPGTGQTDLKRLKELAMVMKLEQLPHFLERYT